MWSLLSFFLKTTSLRASITLAISMPLGTLTCTGARGAEPEGVDAEDLLLEAEEGVADGLMGPISIAKETGSRPCSFRIGSRQRGSGR